MVIQLSTTQPHTTIIARHPPVVSGEGFLVGHSFARMPSKVFLKGLACDYDDITITWLISRVEFERFERSRKSTHTSFIYICPKVALASSLEL